MATRALNVVITGDSKPLGVATTKAGHHIDDVESRGKKMGKTLALGFASAGAAAAGALVVGLKKSVDAAIEAEKSQVRLQAQLNASGFSYRAHAKEIDAVIQKHSRLAGVDDEDLQDAFTNILRATGSVSKAMADMGLVTDLMRGKNLSAAKAGDILAKVHNGNVGALKRLGIEITPVTKAQDKLRDSNDKATGAQKRAAKAADDSATATKAIGELQKRFSGQAEKYGKTAAGAQDRFKVAVENLQEKIGGKLLPVVKDVTGKVSKFVNEMEDGKGAGGAFAKTLNDLTDSITPYTKATGEAVAWTKRHDKAWTVLNENLPNPMRSMRHLTTILDGIKAAADAVVTSVKAVVKALGWVGNAAKDAADFVNPFGDGLGKMGGGLGSTLPSGKFGGGLMGARPSMAPFASAASRFGLHVSSGKRPGSITSSGNVSYHSSGEAIDVAGSPSGMAGFFRQMKSTAGSRLAELIYTGPGGGVGVKNGQPYTYGGQVAADHHDHVHVAYDTGVPGVGDGIGQIKSLWTRAGGSSSAQNMAAAIAMAESGGSPTASNRNSDGSIDRGLWQINSIHGALSTFDRMGNAKAAVSISSNGRNWNPWTVYKTGAYKRFLTSGGGASSGGSSKSKATGITTGSMPGPIDNSVMYPATEGPDESVTAAQGYLDRKAGKGARPAKGGGPTKGISQDEADARDAAADAGDPNQPLIDAINAKAVQDEEIKRATEAHTAALTAVADELKRQTNTADKVRSTSEYQLTKTLADLLSGHIVGRGVMGRSFTPGAGVEVAYMYSAI